VKRGSGGGFSAGTMEFKHSPAFTDFLPEDPASGLVVRVIEMFQSG
jgi:hypothetical protein